MCVFLHIGPISGFIDGINTIDEIIKQKMKELTSNFICQFWFLNIFGHKKVPKMSKKNKNIFFPPLKIDKF